MGEGSFISNVPYVSEVGSPTFCLLPDKTLDLGGYVGFVDNYLREWIINPNIIDRRQHHHEIQQT